jgi:hypothetical protein
MGVISLSQQFGKLIPDAYRDLLSRNAACPVVVHSKVDFLWAIKPGLLLLKFWV